MIERTIKHAGRTWHVREYDLDTFLRAAVDEPPHALNADHYYAKCADGRDTIESSWLGCTMAEAKALRTWPAGREKMNAINLDGCQLPKPMTRRRVRCWTDDGDEFDRDRFDIGLDDCWQARRPRRVTGGNTIRITVELAVSFGTSSDSMVWSGAAAVRLIDELESAGYRAELDVCASTRDMAPNYNGIESVRVKSAADPLNIDALLLACAHPAFFRFHVFQAELRRPIRAMDPGMGYATDTPEALRGDVHIRKVFDRSAAETLVRDELAKRE